jgi:hypothetical protein
VGTRARPLWTCPRCGARLVSRNLSHSCGPFSVEAFLAGADARGRRLFRRFVALVAACGPSVPAPARTRIAFVAQVRFASVNRIGPHGIDVHFVLPRPLRSPRFRRVEQVGRVFVHHLRLTEPAQLDRQLGAWLRASYREYGERRWLRRGP